MIKEPKNPGYKEVDKAVEELLEEWWSVQEDWV